MRAMSYYLIPVTTTQFDPAIQHLLRLLQGDRAALKRLVNAAIAKYPGKPAAWYLEKVTHDLERERGALR